MRTKIEGTNTFNDYETLVYYFDFPSRKFVKSVQLTFGGYAECNNDEIKSSMNIYKHQVKQMFGRRVKDGYFNKRFIFIDGFHTNFHELGKGLMFHQVFFHLEETYEKPFVVDYFRDIFQELDDFHKGHTHFNFTKYKWRKKFLDAQSQNNNSI